MGVNIWHGSPCPHADLGLSGSWGTLPKYGLLFFINHVYCPYEALGLWQTMICGLEAGVMTLIVSYIHNVTCSDSCTYKCRPF